MGRCNLSSGRYLLNATAATFAAAQGSCLAAGGLLVSYASLQEQQQVEQCFVQQVGARVTCAHVEACMMSHHIHTS